MKYSGIRTNENLRFIKCPVCGNDEFSYDAEFCRICGSAIFNYCQDMYDESGYRISTGCGKPNPGNARYCEYCGNPTLLYKYLTDWEEEKKSSDKYDEIESNIELDGDIEFDNTQVSEKPAESNVLDEFEEITASTPEDLSDAFNEFIEEDLVDNEKNTNKKKN